MIISCSKWYSEQQARVTFELLKVATIEVSDIGNHNGVQENILPSTMTLLQPTDHDRSDTCSKIVASINF